MPEGYLEFTEDDVIYNLRQNLNFNIRRCRSEINRITLLIINISMLFFLVVFYAKKYLYVPDSNFRTFNIPSSPPTAM